MSGLKHLCLALSQKGWGEAALGLNVARGLREAGDDCVFIAHRDTAPLFQGSPFVVNPTSDAMGGLINLLIEETIREHRAGSILLCDFLTTTAVLRAARIDPADIAHFGLPVIAIDTWNRHYCGKNIEFFIDRCQSLSPWLDSITLGLVPVPLSPPLPEPGYYNCLPSPVKITKRVRQHVREAFGVAPDDQLVLFCTASWQQAQYKNADGARVASLTPKLLAEYVSLLGTSVHVVHVGPAALDFEQALGTRYQWSPSLRAEQFDRVLGSADLLLSLNVSATTVQKAVASGLPVVLLENSASGATLEEVEATLGCKPSPRVARWLEGALPIYAFRLWPLGFHDFLEALLRDNPFLGTVRCAQLLDEEKVLQALSEMLFDRTARDELIQAQARYISTVEALPTGAAAVRSHLYG